MNSQNSLTKNFNKFQDFLVCKVPANENGEERSDPTAESVKPENGQFEERRRKKISL